MIKWRILSCSVNVNYLHNRRKGREMEGKLWQWQAKSYLKYQDIEDYSLLFSDIIIIPEKLGRLCNASLSNLSGKERILKRRWKEMRDYRSLRVQRNAQAFLFISIMCLCVLHAFIFISFICSSLFDIFVEIPYIHHS